MTFYDARDDTLQEQQTLFSIKGTGWERTGCIVLRAGKGFLSFQHKWPISWDMMCQSIGKKDRSSCQSAKQNKNKKKSKQQEPV